MGRKSTYSNALAERICARLADGESLRGICADADMPAIATVLGWCSARPAFAEQYARAKQIGLEAWAEDILQIANTPVQGQIVTVKPDGTQEVKHADMIEHRRLQIDSRKWLLSKLAPKKYGDKLDMAVSGSVTVEIVRFGDAK